MRELDQPWAAGHPRTPALLIPGLLAWYAHHQRDLPWRGQRDPYRVLVAELMLQQTQAERVTPRYRAFLEQFPTFAALASAATADVLRAWSGLGYNRRALHLQAIARAVLTQHGGELPADTGALQALPGIGPYTAAAVACFAFGAQTATVDTNIRRVLQRVVAGDETEHRLSERQIWDIAAQMLPEGRAGEWNQALMDLGASICSARAPACERCPIGEFCRFRQQSRRPDAAFPASPRATTRTGQPFRGSTRYYRGQVLRVLTAAHPGEGVSLPALGRQVKEDYASYHSGWLEGVLGELERDGLVTLQQVDGEVTVRLPEDRTPPA